MAFALTTALLLLSAMPASTPTPGPLWSVAIPGHGRAVFVPPSTPGRAPIVIAIHGSWDRPEWICEMLDRALRGDAGILCLRGVLRKERPNDGPRWTVGNEATTRAELAAALNVVASTFGDRVMTSRPILSGFSLGAGMAATLARKEPSAWSGVLLVEGGMGARVAGLVPKALPLALGCGTRGCSAKSAALCRTRSGPCLAETDLRYGHSYNPPFEESGARLLRWLVATAQAASDATPQ